MSQGKVWYVVMDGKAEGPHTEEEIRENLGSGKLSYADLVFKPGLSRWVPVAECKEFERRTEKEPNKKENSAVNLSIPEADDSSEKGWILLCKQKGSDGKGHYVQSGPFTTNQVKRKLERREVKFTDYIWFKGYKQWQLISTISDFDRRSEPEEGSLGIPQMAGNPVSSDNIPTMVAPKPSAVPSSSPPPPSANDEENENTRDNLDKYLAPARKKSRKKLAIAGVGATFGLALTWAALNAYKETAPSKIEVRKVANNPSVATGKTPPSTAGAQAVNPEMENRLPKKPSVLKVVSLKTSSDHPQVILESDLPGGTPIEVHLVAKAGYILKYPSFDMTKKLSVVAGQLPSVDFSKDQLPPGDYTLTISGGDLETSAPFNVGERNADFQKRLKAFQAQVNGQRKKERGGGLTMASNLFQEAITTSRPSTEKTRASATEASKKEMDHCFKNLEERLRTTNKYS